MSNKLSQKKIDALWSAWQIKQNITFVAKKCCVHPITVRRYREAGRWDRRLAEINTKAEFKADNVLVKRRSEDLKLMQAAKTSWFAHLIGKHTVMCEHCGRKITIPVPKLKPFFNDILGLIKLSETIAEQTEEAKPKIIRLPVIVPRKKIPDKK